MGIVSPGIKSLLKKRKRITKRLSALLHKSLLNP